MTVFSEVMDIKITKQSGIYILTSEQLIESDIQNVWKFFTLPENLDRITPNDMMFSITNTPGQKTYAGQIITYRIGILPFIKNNWITEITHVKEKEFFVDEQRFGPYSLWHHEHHFEEIDGKSVKMTDIVNYKLPFGFLGNLMAGKAIRKRLMKIFSFRYQFIESVFK